MNHRPEASKACAARDRGDSSGACQHTCEPAETEACRHKWTVRYSAYSRQREASFGTLAEAQVFQLDLSTKKVTEGALFTDPSAGVVTTAAEARALKQAPAKPGQAAYGRSRASPARCSAHSRALPARQSRGQPG